MEERQEKKRKRKKMKGSESESETSNNAVFPLLLAATISNSKSNWNRNSLIKKCLNKIHRSLLSQSQQTLPFPILSLLPVLLNSKSGGIASRSAEIVGAASLLSLKMNGVIALDDEMVKALISALRSGKCRVSKAACDAVLDLSTTALGRHRLLHFSALQSLMFEFLQVPITSTYVSLCIEDNRSVSCVRMSFKEDGYAISLLQAAITLINSCKTEQLEKIPRKLSENLLVFLKNMWKQVHNQMICGYSWKSSCDVYSNVSNITVNNLAESIFRLSINASPWAIPLQSLLVKRKIFGWTELSFESFMLHHWEVSPFSVRRFSKSLIEEDDIFSSFVKSLCCKESSPTFRSSILQTFVSCVPIASDELDIVSFLEEARNELGCPIIYQQDIRVLRTEKQSIREVHYFHESLGSCCTSPHIFSSADFMKCEEAYKEGYTIALRGVEFRFASIAAVADALASLFGQPSVGANIYLTPPNSQGLARHCDDHCVFVCQLYGTKQWTIFPQPNFQLPRLYDPLDSHDSFEADSSFAGCRKFLLREGDILYIPRGFPHEACTDDGGPSDCAKFSLHVTFGIEVEPPFEWEGFAHVALHCWYQTQKQPHHGLGEPSSGILNAMSVNLLHAMIELIGTSDPTLRKACLVGALSLPLDANCWLILNQESIFNHLINQINIGSKFLEVLARLEMAIEKNEDPFWRMRWLQLLNPERETFQEHDLDGPLLGVQKLLPVYAQHKDVAEVAFMQVKSKFCDEVLFDNVIGSYKMLLEKYKQARKQYMNGMLSLHCNSFTPN